MNARWQCVGERIIRDRGVALVVLKPRRWKWVAAVGGWWAFFWGRLDYFLVVPPARARVIADEYRNWLNQPRVEGGRHVVRGAA